MADSTSPRSRRLPWSLIWRSPRPAMMRAVFLRRLGLAVGRKLKEDELKAKGGIFSKTADWQPYVLTDGLLITGQNPASSAPAAKALLKLLA